MLSLVNPLTAKFFIYLPPYAECAKPINRPTTVEGLALRKIWHWWNYIILHFYVFLVVSSIFVFLCVSKTYQTLPSCPNCPSDQPAKPCKYYQQRAQHFNKTANCSHHYRIWHEHRHWGIGILKNTFRSAIQARAIHHLPGALIPRWLQVANSFQWASPPSTLQKRRLGSLFTISDYDKIIVKYDEIYGIDYGIYLSRAICRMHRPTAVKGLIIC